MGMDTQVASGDFRAYLGLRGLVSRYTVCSPRTAGDTTAAHTVLAILNGAVDRALAILSCRVSVDGSAAIATISGALRLSRQTAALLGGGTAMQKALDDTVFPSSALVTVLGATTADGAAATAITGVVIPVPTLNPGILLGQANPMIMHTAAGVRDTVERELVSGLPKIIRPGFAAAVGNYGLAAQNPATQQYTVTVTVEEYAI